MYMSYNGDRNLEAICSGTEENDREITKLAEALVLKTKLSQGKG